ncbi:TIGR04282 family arsenosugar biosynthesis glycosyltransferase [Cochleicola gelatinilyticus]|uniref:Glycosyltransferase n=1 Tax=Cochleicola gelatinilyticus TaxID=1763537 RepID=A0A167IMM8_9FLAO|nr:TIGR04282 family arsenosugar biosynthesis glycosyltransferase [Cochleicola gelatinilyticus]OAB79829.1 glycosyltransferase [Cochleicola gelatinilyticus]
MAILGTKNHDNKEDAKDVFHFPTSKNALIIFTRNPELGKCKTRLAATVGDESALKIYEFLIQHTVSITKLANADKFVFYSENVQNNDQWENMIYSKTEQVGEDLGARMYHAFADVFRRGYENAIVIGSDMYDLSTQDLNEAFSALENNEFVIGPAEDGGYYLLGMKHLTASVFRNKTWGTNTVLEETLKDLKDHSVCKLSIRNDVDYYEDIKDIDVFKQFLSVPTNPKKDS